VGVERGDQVGKVVRKEGTWKGGGAGRKAWERKSKRERVETEEAKDGSLGAGLQWWRSRTEVQCAAAEVEEMVVRVRWWSEHW